MAVHKLVHAAFRTTSGTVYGTGHFHNIDLLPSHVDCGSLEEGFLASNGEFLTRQQASEELHADHYIQSQELPLEKAEIAPTDLKAWHYIVRNWLQKRLSTKFKAKSSVHMTEEIVKKSDNAVMDAAARQSGWDTQERPEFKAARFLSGGRFPSPEAEQDALHIHGDDLVLAALYAHRLPLTEENKAAVRAVMLTQSLQKAELDIAALPRDVEPVFEESKPTVSALRRAFANHDVHRMQFKGKHSLGVAVAYDDKYHKHYLLKPGSGPLSPAAGIREEKADQSHREVAFVKIAQALGIGEDFPNCELVIIDGVYVAAMDLLPPAYVNIGRVRDNAAKILLPYQKSGQLFKWAVLDEILAQCDRHSGNLMCNPEDNDKVKLIDEGSTFAGEGFSPGRDPRTYIPYYLRAFSGQDFKKLDSEKRLASFPRPDPEIKDMLQDWILGIDESKVRSILVQYGISIKPTTERLLELQAAPDGIEFVLEKWAGF